MHHIPVLKDELIDYLDLKEGLVVVDMTVGLGGHAEAILEKIGEEGRLIAIDWDEENLEQAQQRLAKYQKQIFFYHARFDHLEECLKKAGFAKVDRIYFDLGLSSPHVDKAERGFSFSADGPLDMRFDRNDSGLQMAAEIVNTWSEQELTEIFWKYGEERQGRRLAKAIVAARNKQLIKSTHQLKEIILSLMEPLLRKFHRASRRSQFHREGKHPATKVFQALRIAVNDELNVLKRALQSAFNSLKIGGLLAVISYHSLEDRIVKNFFRDLAKECVCPPEVMKCNCGKKRQLKILTKKPIGPSEEEIKENLRSRSAKMRVGFRV